MSDVKCGGCACKVNIESDVHMRKGEALCRVCALKTDCSISEKEMLYAQISLLEKEKKILLAEVIRLRNMLREYDPYPEEEICSEPVGEKLDTADLDIAVWVHPGFGPGHADL